MENSKPWFKQLLTDTSYFIRIDQDGTAVLLAVYVDDLLIVGRTTPLIRHTIEQLKGHFQVKELGTTKMDFRDRSIS